LVVGVVGLVLALGAADAESHIKVR